MEAFLLIFLSLIFQFFVNLYSLLDILKYTLLVIAVASVVVYVISVIVIQSALMEVQMTSTRFSKFSCRVNTKKVQNNSLANFKYFLAKPFLDFKNLYKTKSGNLLFSFSEIKTFRRLIVLLISIFIIYMIAPSKKLILLATGYLLLNHESVKSFLMSLL